MGTQMGLLGHKSLLNSFVSAHFLINYHVKHLGTFAKTNWDTVQRPGPLLWPVSRQHYPPFLRLSEAYECKCQSSFSPRLNICAVWWFDVCTQDSQAQHFIMIIAAYLVLSYCIAGGVSCWTVFTSSSVALMKKKVLFIFAPLCFYDFVSLLYFYYCSPQIYITWFCDYRNIS